MVWECWLFEKEGCEGERGYYRRVGDAGEQGVPMPTAESTQGFRESSVGNYSDVVAPELRLGSPKCFFGRWRHSRAGRRRLTSPALHDMRLSTMLCVLLH